MKQYRKGVVVIGCFFFERLTVMFRPKRNGTAVLAILFLTIQPVAWSQQEETRPPGGSTLADQVDLVRGASVCAPTDAPASQLAYDVDLLVVNSRKSRSLSIVPGNPGRSTALRVTVVDLPTPFEIWNGVEMWVGPPTGICELGAQVVGCQPSETEPGIMVAALQCDPHFADWSQFSGYGFCTTELICLHSLDQPCSTNADCADPAIHVQGDAIVPSRLDLSVVDPILHSATYAVQAVDVTCSLDLPENFSPALSVATARWADVTSLSDGVFKAPDDVVNTFDVLATISKFQAFARAPSLVSIDVVGLGSSGPTPVVDNTVTISELVAIIGAFGGANYPFVPGATPCGGTP